MKNLIYILTAGLALTMFGISCKDNTVTPQSDNFELSSMSTGDVSDISGTLVLDSVKLLLKNIKLNVASSSDTTNFKTGPYVLYVNPNSRINIIGSAFIPVGTYDKVQFEVHKLGDSEVPPDPEFVDANGRYSVIVKGTFDGVPFVFKSSKSAKQKLNFPNALVITENGRSNITLRVRPYIWFMDSNNQFMDPGNPANQNGIDDNIKDNIKVNFKAFRDNDHNGDPD